MSVSIDITAYSGKGSEEFQKHLKAVKFCIENKLSFPRETSEFFRGKVAGDDLEDISPDSILQYIENGVEVPLNLIRDKEDDYKYTIKVSEIPSSVDEIIVRLS